MPSRSDHQRALKLADLDRAWLTLKSGGTVTDQALRLLEAEEQTVQTPLEALIESLSDQVEADGQRRAERDCELAYHNREHVKDALVALKLLADAAPNALAAEDLHLTILAMVGHDLGHDGLPNRSPRQLEIRSWQMICSLIDLSTLGHQRLRRLRTIILMTDPKDYPRLAQRSRPSVLSTQIALAVDADLFASLLPSRGFLLGARLADEQIRAGLPQAKSLASLNGRAGFLKFAPLLSEAIQSLGMQDLIDAQFSVIQRLSEAERLRPWSPDWGDEFAGLVHDHLRAGKSI
jgi:hypothetical protein